jgi:hypothetical protein
VGEGVGLTQVTIVLQVKPPQQSVVSQSCPSVAQIGAGIGALVAGIGAGEGTSVGTFVGEVVGAGEGTSVGTFVGEVEGAGEGTTVGTSVGERVGTGEGTSVGIFVCKVVKAADGALVVRAALVGGLVTAAAGVLVREPPEVVLVGRAVAVALAALAEGL